MFGQQVLVSELATNHISYLDIGFDFSCLPARLLPFLDLFGTIVTEIGTEKMDYIRFAKEIATCTGGFSHSTYHLWKRSAPDKVDPDPLAASEVSPRVSGTDLRLVAEIFSEISFKDKTRIREIVAREFAWDEHSAQSEGYNLPMMRIFSHLSPAGRYNELLSGVTSYLAVKELSGNYDALEESFLANLQEMAGSAL